MSMFLLLMARILAANGVPAAVCGHDLVLATRCPAPPPASPPPAAPASPTSEATKHTIPLDPKSISNGF